MTKSETQAYKGRLLAKKAELLTTVKARDGLIIEPGGDDMEKITGAAMREQAVTNLNRETTTLKQVAAALQRIEEGSFGICLHCEEDVNSKRLSVIPWTPYCLSCQEIADRNPGMEEEDTERIGTSVPAEFMLEQVHYLIPHKDRTSEETITPEGETVFDRYCPRYRRT